MAREGACAGGIVVREAGEGRVECRGHLGVAVSRLARRRQHVLGTFAQRRHAPQLLECPHRGHPADRAFEGHAATLVAENPDAPICGAKRPRPLACHDVDRPHRGRRHPEEIRFALTPRQPHRITQEPPSPAPHRPTGDRQDRAADQRKTPGYPCDLTNAQREENRQNREIDRPARVYDAQALGGRVANVGADELLDRHIPHGAVSETRAADAQLSEPCERADEGAPGARGIPEPELRQERREHGQTPVEVSARQELLGCPLAELERGRAVGPLGRGEEQRPRIRAAPGIDKRPRLPRPQVALACRFARPPLARSAVEPRRICEGERRSGAVARGHGVLTRSLVLAGPEEVLRQLVGLGDAGLLERDCERAVARNECRAPESSKDRLTDPVVVGLDHGLPFSGDQPQESLALQRRHERALRLSQTRGAERDAARDRPPGERDDLEQRARLRRQGVQAILDHLAEANRRTRGTVAGELCEQEGRPFRLLGDGIYIHRRRSGECSNQLAGLRGVERSQGNLRRRLAAQLSVVATCDRHGRTSGILAAIRENEHHRRCIGRPQKFPKERRAVVAGPLGIVDPQHEPPVVGDPREQLAQRREPAAPDLLGFGSHIQRARLQGGDTCENGEDARERRGVAREQSCDGLGTRQQKPAQLIDERVETLVRDRLLRMTSTAQYARVLATLQLSEEAAHEVSLADARWAMDEHGPLASVSQDVERLPEDGKFARTPDEGVLLDGRHFDADGPGRDAAARLDRLQDAVGPRATLGVRVE